jgi:catechol 2,3-dioxygenase-like lactoylglutathione lyase family enzyme
MIDQIMKYGCPTMLQAAMTMARIIQLCASRSAVGTFGRPRRTAGIRAPETRLPRVDGSPISGPPISASADDRADRSHKHPAPQGACTSGQAAAGPSVVAAHSGLGRAAQPGTIGVTYAGAVHLGLVTIVVREYGPAIGFFVDMLGFDLVADSPSLTGDGRPKRWVVVRPPGAETGLLLARADGAGQAAVAGRQAAGRVGFFLHVEDFGAAYARMAAAGVRFVTAPRTEPYGRVAVFVDIAGNTWDLIGPAPHD